MSFLLGYDIPHAAWNNPHLTIPLGCTALNPQAHIHCHRHRQGTPQTGIFPSSPGNHSTTTLYRRKASLLSQSLYHPRTTCCSLPNLPGQELMVGIQKGCSSKGEWLKNRYKGLTYFSPEKWRAIGSMDLCSNGLKSPCIKVWNNLRCGCWKSRKNNSEDSFPVLFGVKNHYFHRNTRPLMQ